MKRTLHPFALMLLILLIPAAARAQSYNAACPTVGITTAPDATGNSLICNSSNLWEYPAYIHGSTGTGGSAASCASSTAGAIQWTGSVFQGCNGTSWAALGGNPALSSLTSATATNTFDSATQAQTWTWNTLTTQNALTLSSTSETSGSLLTLTNSNTSTDAGSVLNVATASTGAANAVNALANSATSNTAAAVRAVNSGGVNFGYTIYAANTGGSNYGYVIYGLNNSGTGYSEYQAGTSPNYFAGSVSIGTTSPSAKLTSVATTSYSSDTTYAIHAVDGGNIQKRLVLGYDDSINAGVIGSVYSTVSWGNTVINPNGGNVGIGTTSSSFPLTVASQSGTAARVFIQNNDYVNGTAGTALQLGTYAASGNTFSFIQSWNTGAAAYGVLALNYGGGNVGIGTTSASTTLQVAGTVTATAFSGSGAASAWVNFNGTNGTILKSYNVSSVTRNATGDYTINFTAALADGNYTLSGSGVAYSSSNQTCCTIISLYPSSVGSYTPLTKSTTQVRVLLGNSSTGTATDAGNVSVMIFD